jgi:hypothetical protein
MFELRKTDFYFIAWGTLLGVMTALAGKFGYLKADGALPPFGIILAGLLLSEVAFSAMKGVSPASMVSMAGRMAALACGVIVDMVLRSVMGW